MAKPPHSKGASVARPEAQGERGQRGRQEPGHRPRRPREDRRFSRCWRTLSAARRAGQWRNSEASEEA